MFRFPPKDLYGSAEPAIEGDELDVTVKDIPKLPESADNAVYSHTMDSPGMSLLTKMIFFGVIVGIALTFLRSRKVGVQEKSLA